MKWKSLFKKTVSGLVVFCFTFTTVVLDSGLRASFASSAAVPQALSVPDVLGSIDEEHKGTLPKTVIYIQDAHDSLEVQENIAKLIDYFVKDYEVRTVYEEGYEGPVPTDELFGFIEDPEVKQKVSYFLLDKLRI